jgi:uncharacterized membrane protein
MPAPPTATEAAGTATTKPAPRALHSWVVPIRPRAPINPALVRHAELRAEYAQNRVADRITAFSGSMAFVYLHVVWFGCWIGFGVESYPFGLLTMIVSLEAIFLSTFVMISQNRADARRQVIADQQWTTMQQAGRVNDRQNQQLLELAQQQKRKHQELMQLSSQILTLTEELRGRTGSGDGAAT